MSADLATVTAALHAQWDHLRSWLDDADLDDAWFDADSVLPGWTVGELVSHLGRSMEALAVCTAVPEGTVPLTFAEYLGSYPDRAAEITAVTRELDGTLAPDRLAGIDRLAAQAFATLDALTPAEAPAPGADPAHGVVQARRGPITLRDMVVSRVVELVVHADDIARSLPGVPGDPVERGALGIVADELLAIVVARGGWSLEVDDARLWVRLAAGRRPYDVDDLARALRPEFTAGSVPDLGRELPVL
ncbi:uncharacterized protein (TIGR03083 family) [Sediminihabitans luteus]|uniref:Uncharacterized protein (TIGR03083 family) n=1 Tax=Sediminihabitans luteus TaxID=1138585 RepID=A0A2M9CE95_9CELL|nr:maleylpyruvate isomerase N-terminal domain-containing protein [Sediminihabitans luteus]PJJ70251.1 uncharacterized protein (TIGR03083 family) [Sediminihabitans luteus]GII97722.1 hypothetical protein Slu03_01000 [Sediminihabitans luteus]